MTTEGQQALFGPAAVNLASRKFREANQSLGRFE